MAYWMQNISTGSGVATGGGDLGLEPPCDNCDVFFSYIHPNTTKLVFHLSYLVSTFRLLLIRDI